jgi:CheY-like chemotaxis protein
MSNKILVVEDEIALRETLVYNLEHEGYRVGSTDDGQEALKIARETQPESPGQAVSWSTWLSSPWTRKTAAAFWLNMA